MNSQREQAEKKPYESPQLTVYGPIRELTRTNPVGIGQRDNSNPYVPAINKT